MINITLNRKVVAQARGELPLFSPYNKRYGFWGVVTEAHSDDCTVNVRMDNGIEAQNIRVASSTWVTSEKDKDTTGERHLPPLGSYVFCMMPTGELSSAFVLCSGFALDSATHSAFKVKDAAATWERVENNGWHFATDYGTGSVTLANKTAEATITLSIDQNTAGEEVVTLAAHGNTITINKDGVDFKTDGKVDIHIDGDASIEANKATLTSTETTLTGGKVIIGGAVTPTGTGALCGLPSCLFTGAPHTGDTTEGA